MGNSSSSSSGGGGGKLDDSGTIQLIGKVMVVAVLVLFLVIVFVFFVHLYAKWVWQRNSQDNNTNFTARRRRRRLFDFALGYQEQEGEANGAVTRGGGGGLDPRVLKTLPVVVFGSSEGEHQLKEDGLECAVCLSEISEGEKIRILPKCNNHGFHVECIDMWFQSHSTCPLCRSPVSDSNKDTTDNTHDLSRMLMQSSPPAPLHESSTIAEPVNFPTNVLFWGDETQVRSRTYCLDMEDEEERGHQAQPITSSSSSSSRNDRPDGDGMLVIDIPSNTMNNDDNDEQREGEKKPGVGKRLRSFKRLLSMSSRDRKVSPRCDVDDVDLEQQGSTSQSL